MAKKKEGNVIFNLSIPSKLREEFHLFAKNPEIGGDTTKVLRAFMELCTNSSNKEETKASKQLKKNLINRLKTVLF